MTRRPGPLALLHRPLPVPPDALRQGPLREGAFRSPLHNRYNAAWLGYALGWSFLVCFLTGLISHQIQHPASWFYWPASPSWLYRATQGTHVATGLACIPLLLAKLWTVYPNFWEWPPVRSLAHALERLSLIGLVGGAVFQLLTGLANIYEWYFFKFFFTPTHYFTAYVTMGSLVIHIGTKIALAREALAHPERYAVREPAPVSRGNVLSRRWFLGTVTAAAATVTAVTVGESVSPLGAIDLLGARKPGTGVQHVPVNKTSAGAGVRQTAVDPAYRLQVRGAGVRQMTLSLDDLRALPQTTVHLPITCVEGWSVNAHWTGVRLRDLLSLAGVAPGRRVRVESLERGGLYRSSIVEAPHSRSHLTLLAMKLNGADLDLDHGYPLRLIGPSRPGVMQTKWVTEVVVL